MSPYPKPEKKPHNLCRNCQQDFNSVDLFERHRVGVHEYTHTEGLRDEPPPGWQHNHPGETWTPREDGRRCLSVDEMTAKGWEPNERGYWIDPEKVEDARARLGRKA